MGMLDQRYDIFFSGSILDGQDPATVREKIGKMFRADAAQLERLFSGQPVKVKAGVDQDMAIKYRVAFREAGALIDIVPVDGGAGAQPTGNDKPSAPATHADDDMTLLPPRTGSLIDCAKTVEAAEIPDISQIALDSPGTDLDDSEPPPPADIDTSSLQLNPANSGSLEDCYKPPQPKPIPDISRLKIVDSPGE
jgi:hypothetical protein